LARRAMSLLDLIAWVSRWRGALEGARIDNVYNLKEGEGVVVKVKGVGVQGEIVAEAGRRLHFTRRDLKAREQVPRGLAALARKHLRGAKITGVGMLGSDRVAYIEASTGHRLYVELVPRGVVALVSPEGLILGATRHEDFRDRSVRPRREYKPPPLSGVDPFSLDAARLAELAASGRDLVRGLIRGAKVPAEAAEEAIHRCGLRKDLKPGEVPAGGYECIAEKLREIHGESLEGRGFLALEAGEADPFRPTRFERVREYSVIDEALDDLFASGVAGEAGEAEDPELARLKASMEEARRLAEEYRRRAGELRRAAEALAAMYHEAEEALRLAADGVVRRPVVEVGRGEAVLEVDGVRVNVKLGLTLDRVIVDLYRRVGELEAKARRAEAAAEEVVKRLGELRLKSMARRFQALARLRRRHWFERYHWTVTRSGFLAVGGRDAGQNESVVKRYLGPRDIFMHADIHGAPAVVLKVGGAEPGEGDLYDAAVIAAAYSRAWKAGLGSVSVYWVWGEQVSKSAPAGEYIARGGFMVYGRRNYIGPVRLELALGVALDEEGAPLVLAGSEEVVRRYSIAYAILAPGDTSLTEAPGEVKKALAAKAQGDEARAAVLGVPDEEVEKRLPGRIRILRAAKGEGLPFKPPAPGGEG